MLIDYPLWLSTHSEMANRFDQFDFNVKWNFKKNSNEQREDLLLLMCLKKALN